MKIKTKKSVGTIVIILALLMSYTNTIFGTEKKMKKLLMETLKQKL